MWHEIFFSLVTTAAQSEEKNTIGIVLGTVVSVTLLVAVIVAACRYVYQSFIQVLNVGI